MERRWVFVLLDVLCVLVGKSRGDLDVGGLLPRRCSPWPPLLGVGIVACSPSICWRPPVEVGNSGKYTRRPPSLSFSNSRRVQERVANGAEVGNSPSPRGSRKTSPGPQARVRAVIHAGDARRAGQIGVRPWVPVGTTSMPPAWDALRVGGVRTRAVLGDK